VAQRNSDPSSEPKKKPAPTRRLAVMTAAGVALGGGWFLLREHILPTHPGPYARFENARADLGSVPAGESAEARFTLRNDGAQELRILDIVGDCGCVTTESPGTLGSGKKGQIVARFQAQAIEPGHVEKHLNVKTDDPRHPVQTLTISANVEPLIRFEPKTPLFFSTAPGKTYHQDVKLGLRPGLKLGQPISETPSVQARITQPAGSPDPVLRLTIGPCPTGDFQGRIWIPAADKDLGKDLFILACQAASGPVANPPQVYAKVAKGAPSGTEVARFLVTPRRGQLQVTRVDTGASFLRAEVKETKPQEAFEVTLRLAEKWQPARLKTTLRVHTSPGPLTLDVPFTGVVR
jgi:hypothetical protein